MQMYVELENGSLVFVGDEVEYNGNNLEILQILDTDTLALDLVGCVPVADCLEVNNERI